MKTIGLLKNTIQEYAWGSYTAIPDLLGENSPAQVPQAELWMGAHPKAPSRVKCQGKWRSLPELIAENPEAILGKTVARKFDNSLPYLFKVLAAAKPLSIQAHPSRTQALKGFERENELGIPFDAYNRNYKDDNHKPECICALTPFWALNGFRKISEILSLIEKVCPQGLENEIKALRIKPNSQGLKDFFQILMTMNQQWQNQVIDEALLHAKKYSEDNQIYKWMISLHHEYPSDIGIFSPILLNLICLEPGQAMFLQAGELHAYLDGAGIELMANSDNVLRGGLTPKHVDVPELLNVLNFEEREISVLSQEAISDSEGIYSSQAEEFILSVIQVKKDVSYTSPVERSIEIILCTNGKATITDIEKGDILHLNKGSSVIIPAAVETYGIDGEATFYKASVPVSKKP